MGMGQRARVPNTLLYWALTGLKGPKIVRILLREATMGIILNRQVNLLSLGINHRWLGHVTAT
jgi:hypothetical protein